MRYIAFGIACLCLSAAVTAQSIPSYRLDKQWDAFWITVPDMPVGEYQVCLFRKILEMPERPPTYVIHVSADNRYKLFVNGTLVSLGPARGDLSHWRFESVNIAPYLKPGKNVIAAQVWNEADWRPEAQISLRTGFILQASTPSIADVNTNNTWKCIRDESYTPLKVNLRTYYVTGPGEYVDLGKQPKNWKDAGFDDSHWKNAQTLFKGTPKNMLGPYGTPNGWMLVQPSIPPMEMKEERFGRVVRSSSVTVPAAFPQAKTTLNIPANTTATLLLDHTVLTNAYPTLVFSGGKSATLSMSYAEALYSKYPEKGNRNETDGKILMGRKDSLLSDGTPGQMFTPLNFRTFRYVQISIKTQNEPLVLDDLYSTFTGYPFKFEAKLESGTAEMDKMLEIGWRTARLCAVETYMDCPYYEQLQYIGDGRIQALVSLYNSGDDRLLRNALDLMDHSRQPEGFTLSRHPSYTPQSIPTFSLWYIGMLHDYHRYGRDASFVRQKLNGMRQILDYFHVYQQADGSVWRMPQWMFTDWVEAKGWESGVGPASAGGTSAMVDLQLLWAYQLAAELEAQLGMQAYSDLYKTRVEQLKTTIRSKYWNAERNLYADDSDRRMFSQHTNALAILTGLADGPQARELAERIRDDKTLAPASIYFRYYLHQAWVKAGFGDDYLKWLDKWRENMDMGLTTWAEISDVNKARSDCHAWGSSPNIEFFRTVLGIDSAAPGFSKVKIEPHLGGITKIGGSIPHPAGTLSVHYHLENGRWNVRIDLPEKVTGSLVWKGKTVELKSGENKPALE